jgi:hypothetical protein
LTWVSEGKDFRRLRVTLKALEVFEIIELAHDTPPSLESAASLPRRFATTSLFVMEAAAASRHARP